MVRELLDSIQATAPDLVVREVELASDYGFELARRFGILFPPAIVVGGRLIGQDEIPERELRRALTLLASEATA